MNRDELTKEMRWYIADRLAEDRLPIVNTKCQTVIPRDTFYTRHGKRMIDIAVSALALIVTLPVNTILGICTLLDVGRPIFFRQERLGKDGKLFTIVKFRNMRDTKDERGELLPPDQRVTKFGKFMRKTSLDELLNFWSILKGDMSLIGPRPLVPEYKHRFNKRHIMRLAVRPGLECPPRMSTHQIWTWQEQFENDIWYVENVSFRTDCYMIWRLFIFTFDKRSAEARAIASRGIFMGYDLNGCAITLDEVPESYINECKSQVA